MRWSVAVVATAVILAAACGGTSTEPPRGAAPPAEPVAPPAAPVPPPAAPVPAAATGTACPEGVETIPYWQGEYPGPVISVTKEITRMAYAAPCDPTPTRSCTLAPGVYHPWAKGPGLAFVTLRPPDRWRATRAFVLTNGTDSAPVAAGAEVLVTGYLGEGFCMYRVGSQEFETSCPELDDAIALERTSPIDQAERQLFQTTCGWFAVDDGLFATDGVREGTIVSYGEVGP